MIVSDHQYNFFRIIDNFVPSCMLPLVYAAIATVKGENICGESERGKLRPQKEVITFNLASKSCMFVSLSSDFVRRASFSAIRF